MPSQPSPYRRLQDKPFESLYLIEESVIDAPIERVFAKALDIGAWMSAHRLEPIDGELGKVGYFERVYPKNLAADTAHPHYHLYGIADVVPNRMIVLEVFNENGGSYGKTRLKLSLDSILFTDLGTRTHVLFHMVDVHLGKGEETFIQSRKRELEGVRNMLRDYFKNLAKLVEGAA